MFNFIRNWLDIQRFGAARSPRWSSVRKDFLKINPLCAVCDRKSKLLRANEVHHCKPFHLHPELETEPNNLITLCREHHLLVGHLMSWKSFNENVRIDAEVWKQKIQSRPKVVKEL